MSTLLISFSIALLLTVVFAFRFGFWRRPWLLLVYYLVFQTLEGVGEYFFLPRDALPIEIAYVCLPLSAVFIGIIVVVRRYEETAVRPEDAPTGASGGE
jgi:hypothetical protein